MRGSKYSGLTRKCLLSWKRGHLQEVVSKGSLTVIGLLSNAPVTVNLVGG